MLNAPPVLEATAVRHQVLAAVRPVLDGIATELPGLELDPDLRLLVQVEPAIVRVAMAAREGRPARDVGGLTFSRLPDRGATLRDAFTAAFAGVLSSLDEGGAIALGLADKWRGVGGLVLVVDPFAGEVTVLLAPPGADLGDALVLGVIGDDAPCDN